MIIVSLSNSETIVRISFSPSARYCSVPFIKRQASPWGNRAVGGLGCERGTLRQMVDERNQQKLDL